MAKDDDLPLCLFLKHVDLWVWRGHRVQGNCCVAPALCCPSGLPPASNAGGLRLHCVPNAGATTSGERS